VNRGAKEAVERDRRALEEAQGRDSLKDSASTTLGITDSNERVNKMIFGS